MTVFPQARCLHHKAAPMQAQGLRRNGLRCRAVGQLLANRVGPGKIPGLLGLGPLLDHLFDPRS